MSRRFGDAVRGEVLLVGSGTQMTASDYVSPSGSQRQYRMLFKVGRGGMGDVHLALSTGHGAFRKLVVLKCRRPTPGDESERRGMFLEEGRLAALLNHPNIVQTYEVGQLAGTDYIAMEYLEGQPVSHLSAKAGGLAPRVVAYIAEQVLRGLHYAQELRDLDGTPLNIIHRDLSPENIFVTYEGAVKVLDFGIAKSDARSREVTEAGVLKGKLSYMAPEQVETFTADRRTDIFVLGMVMWELITGSRLNANRSAVDQFRWLTEGKVPALSGVVPVDAELEAIVEQACQRKPVNRFATARDMQQALEAYLSKNGAGAAEQLSRVMVGQFGRTRDALRAHVRHRIQELERDPAQALARNMDVVDESTSEITYVVQSSDLVGGDEAYRNATTGRITAPARGRWATWVGLACACAFSVAWFQYARRVGTESVMFRLLSSDAPSIQASGVAAMATPPAKVEVGPIVAGAQVVVEAPLAVEAPRATEAPRVIEVLPSVVEEPASVTPRHEAVSAPSESSLGRPAAAPGERGTVATDAQRRPRMNSAVEPADKVLVPHAKPSAASAVKAPKAASEVVTPRVDNARSSRVPMVD